MSEKKKKHSNCVGTMPFVLLWALSYGLGWGGGLSIAYILDNIFPNFLNQLPEAIVFILVAAVPALISSIAQQFLIQWKFGIAIKRLWLWNTLAAALIGLGIYGYMEANIYRWVYPFARYLTQMNELLEPVIGFGILFGLYSIVQAWLLRHHIHRVWLWSLAAFVSASTFILPITDMYTRSRSEFVETIFIGIAGLAQGSVMALTLVWLFGMTRTEPFKRGMESTQLEAAKSNLPDDDNDESVADYPQQETMMRRSK